MAGAVGSMLMPRVVALSRSATAKGLEIMGNPKLAIGAFQPRAGLSPTMLSSRSLSFAHMGLHSHHAITRFDPITTGSSMIANSPHFRRSPQLDRYLNPRPWNARRLLSTTPTVAAGPGSPNPEQSFFVQLIEKIIQFFAAFLPSKALVETVEAEVDAAAAMVEEGAKIVSDIANRVEELANAAELGAEEVERIAEKIAEMAKKVQTIVDDVANVLEGETGFTTLRGAIKQLNNVAAAKRAQANDIAAAATTTVIVSDTVAAPSTALELDEKSERSTTANFSSVEK